ncbi:FlgO family outer membrane protein [Nitratidesulfovibrio termitidis]|uniref:FlgO family outer membrane protein n=1 Tax=Nitratidesulfovibrio termitidis TaxID=42252 RepID=UPI00041DC807|nr:FlgO family outer membrane protein [Nitratidesulfovibrio termitidis]
MSASSRYFDQYCSQCSDRISEPSRGTRTAHAAGPKFLLRTVRYGIGLLAIGVLAFSLHAVPARADAGPVGAAARQPAAPEGVLVNPPEGSELLNANTYAADALHAVMASRVSTGSPILVATLADVDNLERSTPFGRVTMQQVASRLGQHGYRVLEARMGRALTFTPQGEFLLSRDATRLMQSEYDAQAALVGTYSLAGGTAYVSLRVVRLDDAAVMAAYEYHLPVRGDTRKMMAGQGDPWSQYAGRRQAFSGAAVASATGATGATGMAGMTGTLGQSGGRPVYPAPVAVPSPAGAATDPAAMPLLKDFPPIGSRSSATTGKPVVKKAAPAQKQAVKKPSARKQGAKAPAKAPTKAPVKKADGKSPAKPAARATPKPAAAMRGADRPGQEVQAQPVPVWRAS